MEGETLRLRVDDGQRLQLAGALHSSSRPKCGECNPDTPADLIWSASQTGHPMLALSGEAGAVEVSEAGLFFLSEHHLTQQFTRRLHHLLQFHAGAVVDPRGRGWLICGPSRAGKTSLTLSLVLAGWGWLSDEYVLVRQETPGVLRGFPRNFNLKESSFGSFPETADGRHTVEFRSESRQMLLRFLDPLDVAPGSWHAEAPLKGLLLPTWNPDGSRSEVSAMAGVGAAQVLLEETACWQPWAFEVVSSLCRDLPVLAFRYSDARDIAGLVKAIEQIPD
jgi:hypothetical protein